MDYVHLKITDQAIRKRVEKTLFPGLGARGVRNMYDKRFNDFFLETENVQGHLEIYESIIDNKLKNYFKA